MPPGCDGSGVFSARRQGDIWFRESIRMENAVLGRIFHMNNAEITAKRIGMTISVDKECLTTDFGGKKYNINYYNLDVFI